MCSNVKNAHRVLGRTINGLSEIIRAILTSHQQRSLMSGSGTREMDVMMNGEMTAVRNFKDDILREQVRLTFRQLPTMQLTSFIVALGLAYAVFDIVPLMNIVIWLTMILAVLVSRIFLYTRFLKLHEEPFVGEYWKKAHLLLTLVSGTVWGLSAFIIFPAKDSGLIFLFILAMASLSASTTISHSSLRMGPALWAGPVMLLYAARCAMDADKVEHIVVFLIIVYLFAILAYSFKHYATIASSISLKFENLALLEDLKKANDILRKTSAIDGLTGLANRNSFEEFIEREWGRAARNQKPISLVMLDIDHFKAYNDNYGHQEGDDCLKKVASVLAKSATRSADIAARYGGEEFIVVLPDTDSRGAVEVAEKLRIAVEMLSVPHSHSPTASVVTASIGVASLVPDRSMDYSRLVKSADAALYAAKRDGRNRVKVNSA
jgi:diguanylate cyclase (GGDEF)-like protein